MPYSLSNYHPATVAQYYTQYFTPYYAAAAELSSAALQPLELLLLQDALSCCSCRMAGAAGAPGRNDCSPSSPLASLFSCGIIGLRKRLEFSVRFPFLFLP